jgi:hypothetical protein
VNTISRGFRGRRRSAAKLPPGQYLEHGFPILQAGPTPSVRTATWAFTITTETGETRRWDWKQFTALPSEDITVDIHCVTQWSKLATNWRGVSLDLLLDGVTTEAGYAMARSYGGYTTTHLRPRRSRCPTCATARPGSRTPTTASRSAMSTAARPGCSYRTCTSGSPPSGSPAST